MKDNWKKLAISWDDAELERPAQIPRSKLKGVSNESEPRVRFSCLDFNNQRDYIVVGLKTCDSIHYYRFDGPGGLDIWIRKIIVWSAVSECRVNHRDFHFTKLNWPNIFRLVQLNWNRFISIYSSFIKIYLKLPGAAETRSSNFLFHHHFFLFDWLLDFKLNRVPKRKYRL